jgi:hypothetical protein
MMLNGFVALPKPDSEIKNGSKNPVSGDAVYDYIQDNKMTVANSVVSGNVNPVSSGAVYNAIQAIPAPASAVYKSNGMTYITATWAGASNAIILGDVITFHFIIVKQTADVSLDSNDVQIGTLGPDIPRPLRITPFILIPNPTQATNWLDCVSLTGYIYPNDVLNNKNGEIFICRHPGITISGIQKQLIGSITWIQRTVS